MGRTATLTQDRIASVVAMRIGPPPRTLDSIARELGCTRERVRQMLDCVYDSTIRASLARVSIDCIARSRAVRAAVAVEKRESRMTMSRINKRLGERGLKWCTAGKHACPLDAMATCNGIASSRCKACCVVSKQKAAKVQKDNGRCVTPGCKNVPTGDHVLCDKHRQLMREYDKRKRAS